MTRTPEQMLGRPLNPGDPAKQISRDDYESLKARLRVLATRLASTQTMLSKDERIQAARDIERAVDRI